MSSATVKKNLTEGKILPQIISFALPLIATAVLQLLFNTADMFVVGRWGGDTQAECEIALGAVGSCAPLINLLVNLFMGLSVGAGVCVAHEIGAKHYSEVKSVVNTAVILSLIAGAIVTAVGIIFAPHLLMLMGVENSLLEPAVLYMRAYFFGIPAALLYNFCASMLRSAGDTSRPLIFLSVAGVVNVMLNLVMVLGFHTGAMGVGVATAASNWVSCTMIVIFMMRTDGPCKLSLKGFGIDRIKFKKIISIGLPAGLQSSLFSISNVIIQSAIQSFGTAAVVAGNTAASNIDGYIYVVINCFATSAMTFTGQHVGAGKYERLKKVLLWHALLIVTSGIALGTLSYIFAEPLIGIFQPGNKAAAEVGLTRLGILGLTYFTCGLMDMGCYSLRGFGKSLSPTIVSLTGSCLFRIVWIYAVFYPFFSNNIAMLYLSYPISWIVTGGVHYIFCVYFYRKLMKRKKQAELSAPATT